MSILHYAFCYNCLVGNDFIWTKHVLKRLKDRRISQDLVIQAIVSPDETTPREDATQYKKIIEKQTVATIVKQNEKGENIILSAWVDPPNIGTADYKRKKRFFEAKNASVAKKLWLTFLNQVGL